MRRYWLNSAVSKGMFPNERTVVVTDVDGKHFTFLVPDGVVRDGGQVQVRVVGKTGDERLVLVPGDAMDANNAITVHDAELEEVG